MLKNIPWDWSNLSSKDGQIELEENDIVINKIDDNRIEFAKITLDIHSLVYENATAEEIAQGFEELNSFFDFIRVIQVLLKSSLIKANVASDRSLIEPDIADFLKICYWYNKIKNIQTIEHRRKELRSRLCKKLLHKLERGKRTINYSDLSDDEIRKKIDETLDKITREQTEYSQNQMFNWLNEYLNFINVCISELMFAALANESDLTIDFTPAANDYDYDLIIDGRPIQIKTLFCYDAFAISKSQEVKQQKYVKKFKELSDLYNNSQITWPFVKQEIIKYIKSDCIHVVNNGLRQQAEIIILDGTRTIPGLLLNYYYTDDSKFVKMHNSFVESLNNRTDNIIPVIFASTSYDNRFRISSVVVNVPVKKVNQVTNNEKNKIYI